MIILDTNVISNLIAEKPSPAVEAWFASVGTENLYLTTITETEVLRGPANMPLGKKRSMLEAAYETVLEDFAERILAYDSRAARAYAGIEAHRRSIGRPISQFDCQIAAIAKTSGMKIATRDVGDFEGCGVEVVNPWEASPG